MKAVTQHGSRRRQDGAQTSYNNVQQINHVLCKYKHKPTDRPTVGQQRNNSVIPCSEN